MCLVVTFPSISWFVSNSKILLQDSNHEVGQWIRIVRDDYHLINHPFKQQNLPWSWATVQQSTYFFWLLKWALCGLRMVIRLGVFNLEVGSECSDFRNPVRRTATMRISGEWMQFRGMFLQLVLIFCQQLKSEMIFNEGPLLFSKTHTLFFLWELKSSKGP